MAVYDRTNTLLLVVEVKARLGASPEWGAQLRRNIAAHGLFPEAPYFLLALPDRFYLWSNTATSSDSDAPSFSVNPSPLLRPYFERADISPDQISSQSLELIIASWLNDMISRASQKSEDEVPSWLKESGLYEAMSDARLEQEVLA